MIRLRSADKLLIAGVALLSLHLVTSLSFAQDKSAKPKPLAMVLDTSATHYQELLSGFPQTVSMESGFVVIAPSKAGETHSTKTYEEVLVVLSGSGEMRVTDRPAIKFHSLNVVYCPPQTEHKIVNTGTEPLKYVYVAAKALR